MPLPPPPSPSPDFNLSRRDVLMGVVTAAGATFVGAEWGHKAAPYLLTIVVLGVLLIVLDAYAPRWRERRAIRRRGSIRIVGGYRSSTELVIRYENGRRDTEVIPAPAAVTVTAGSPEVEMRPERRAWLRRIRWWQK